MRRHKRHIGSIDETHDALDCVALIGGDLILLSVRYLQIQRDTMKQASNTATMEENVDPILLGAYLLELDTQCNFALMAADRLISSLQQLDQDEFWFELQSFLVAAANVSKLLWQTSDGYAKNRSQELRQLLGVTEPSPLSSWKLRNHFEHFDERIDTWARKSQGHNFVDRNISPRRMIQGVAPEDYLRNFDQETFVVNFREDEFELLPLIAALGDIRLCIINLQ